MASQRRGRGSSKKVFFYNDDTFETTEIPPEVYFDEKTGERFTSELPPKSEYATKWEDERFPEWCEFLELNTKRPYYFNRRTGECTWAHPEEPDTDVFRKEMMQEDAEWMRVPDNVPNGSLIKRCGAALIDGVATLAAAGTFGLFVSGELSNAGAAIPAVGFSWWLLFLGRDMFIERGTRSPGKSCST